MHFLYFISMNRMCTFYCSLSFYVKFPHRRAQIKLILWVLKLYCYYYSNPSNHHKMCHWINNEETFSDINISTKQSIIVPKILKSIFGAVISLFLRRDLARIESLCLNYFPKIVLIESNVEIPTPIRLKTRFLEKVALYTKLQTILLGVLLTSGG